MESRRIVQGGAIVALIATVIVVSSAAGTTGFYSKVFDLPIPSPDDPCSPYGKGRMKDAVIKINDVYIIDDLDVHICLTHTDFMDLEIILQSPAGTNVLLKTWGNIAWLKVRGYRDILFDDEAEVSIETPASPSNGPYKPAEPLSAFNGQSAFGRWKLRIYDGIYNDFGELHNAELIIGTPEPTTALFLVAGAVLLMLRRR